MNVINDKRTIKLTKLLGQEYERTRSGQRWLQALESTVT